VTPKQKAAAAFYAKATPKQARKRALRKYRLRRGFKLYDREVEAIIATALTRREAAGFARGVEAVCKIADSMSLQWSRAGAQETARSIASAGRALLGEGKE
jgi:hypothetical protein